MRKEKPDLFAHGSYTALDVTGDRADHVCAFARVRGDDRLLVAVPRLIAALDGGSGWADTMLAIPGDARGRWRNVFTGAMLNPLERDGSAGLSAAHVFEAFPVALLTAAAT